MAVWDESKHPRDLDGKFTEKTARRAWAIEKSIADLQSALMTVLPEDPPEKISPPDDTDSLPETIHLPDEQLPRSVGAMWKNEDILMPDGSYAHFVEGTKLQNKEVFAGKGCRRKIDDEERLIRQYGGTREEWMKIKARATISWKNVTDEAEIHWYEERTVGRVEFKFKRWES